MKGITITYDQNDQDVVSKIAGVPWLDEREFEVTDIDDTISIRREGCFVTMFFDEAGLPIELNTFDLRVFVSMLSKIQQDAEKIIGAMRKFSMSQTAKLKTEYTGEKKSVCYEFYVDGLVYQVVFVLNGIHKQVLIFKGNHLDGTAVRVESRDIEKTEETDEKAASKFLRAYLINNGANE